MKYTMTQAQYDKIIATIDVARKAPVIMLQCGMPESPQAAANRAWLELGSEMGFDGMSVRPGESKLEFHADHKESV